MRTHETLPLILAALVLPFAIWFGWTGFHAPIDDTESETET